MRTTHQEFGGRVTTHDGAGLSSHATHVAGTMVASGVDASAIGMSNAATLRSYDWNSDTSEMAAAQLLPQPVSVSNHSYGQISGWIFNFFNDGLWVWFGDVAISELDGDAPVLPFDHRVTFLDRSSPHIAALAVFPQKSGA